MNRPYVDSTGHRQCFSRQSSVCAGVLSCQDRAELSYLHTQLDRISTSINLLEIGEDSLNVVFSNLLRMRQLVSPILGGFCDDVLKAEIKAELDTLRLQILEVSDTAAYDGTLLHRNAQVFHLFGEEQDSLLWVSQCLPDISTDILSNAEEVYQKIENAIENISSYRGNVYSLLMTLQQYNTTLYDRLEAVLKSNLYINSATAAKAVCYRTAAQLLQSECTCLAGRTSSICAIAGLYLS